MRSGLLTGGCLQEVNKKLKTKKMVAFEWLTRGSKYSELDEKTLIHVCLKRDQCFLHHC